MNKLRFQKQVIYRLKRDYGVPATIYRQTGETYDLKTGKKIVLKVYQHVDKIIFLPGVEAQDFDYSSMGANFARGGFFGSTERLAAIDREDLNSTFDILKLNDYIIKDHERYQIKRISPFEGGFAYWLVLDETANAPNYEIFDRSFEEKLRFFENVMVTK
jgi:hypothetical protein